MGLDPYPEISLKEARQRAIQARNDINKEAMTKLNRKNVLKHSNSQSLGSISLQMHNTWHIL
jgi:hypothetical protein